MIDIFTLFCAEIHLKKRKRIIIFRKYIETPAVLFIYSFIFEYVADGQRLFKFVISIWIFTKLFFYPFFLKMSFRYEKNALYILPDSDKKKY